MRGSHRFAQIRNLLFSSAVSLALNGCLMGEPVDESTTSVDTDIEISGSVGDGPIIGAAIQIMAKDGSLLAELESTASAGYNISIKTRGKHYPLSIDARNGIDIVTSRSPDFMLKAAVIEPAKKVVANVNPFSTLAMEIARDLAGGASKANIALGEEIAVTSMNCGLTSLASTGPMSTRIDAENITEIVKASEALGEVIRRTRDWLAAFGVSASGDQIMQALGSDLVDRVIDGRGGPRADARIAAVASIVTAQVSLETMSNELHVDGVDATNAMANAIRQVSTDPAVQSLDDLTATAPMLAQARVGLAAAAMVSGDQQVTQLWQTVGGFQPGLDSMLIRNLLPADYRQLLDNVLAMIAGGDDTVVTAVNDIIRSGGTDPTVNRPPSISGTPATTVLVGTAYSFTPTAADPDNDTLSFSISGQPGWASFDAATGALTGTPASSGTFNNIVISVSDGQATASLAGFSITVSAVNSPPTIGGTPPPSVAANSPYSFTPTASDPDNDTLTFSVTGLPSWAAFDTQNGTISGTPGDADVNTYTGITITVTDGSDSASLGPFSITVEAVSLGSATLSWTPPTQNIDGSPLTDLAGFKIYWGTGGSWTNSVTINNPGVTTYVIDNLAPGTYEFTSTALNSLGIESAQSNIATKTISP